MARKGKFDWASYCELYAAEIRSGKTTIDKVPEQARQEVEALLGKQQVSSWTIGKWKHPVTGRERLYVNSSEIWRGVKVWFECGVSDVVQIQVAGTFYGDDPRAVAAARQLAEEIATKFAGSYSAIAAMAK
jgi:hypothetical protein